MSTVAQTTETRNIADRWMRHMQHDAGATVTKQLKAFYATLYDEAGYLTQGADDVILFLAHGSTTPHIMTPEDCMWVVVNGEVGTAVGQFVRDTLAGGAAFIATHRRQGVA
jgi:hypothetical protein